MERGANSSLAARLRQSSLDNFSIGEHRQSTAYAHDKINSEASAGNR